MPLAQIPSSVPRPLLTRQRLRRARMLLGAALVGSYVLAIAGGVLGVPRANLDTWRLVGALLSAPAGLLLTRPSSPAQ